MKKFVINLFALFYILTFTHCTNNKLVDLIVYNAKVYTVDSTFSVVEAFAINNGVFVALGNSQELLSKYEAKEKIDAKGKFIYPGFYDAHGHFFMLAEALDQLDLVGSTSFDEVIERIKVYRDQNPNKKWIIGNGWDQNLWPDKKFPVKDSLDKYFPDLPIFLTRIDYHAALANQKALSISSIDSAFQVDGGLIAVNEAGLPDGILIDNAMQLVTKHIPKPQNRELLAMLKRAQDSLLSVGLTSIVDAGLTENQIDALKVFYNEDSLKIRDYAMLAASPSGIKEYLKKGTFESDRLTVRSFKLMADGALGSRGACLLAPYQDAATTGFLLQPIAELEDLVKRMANSNFQVSTHAIGDSANRVMLDLYGKYLKKGKDRRWRIEHAQVLHPLDFSKFKEYQIIPSVQPTHATSDMSWAEERLGPDRVKGAYAYRNLLDQYGMLALGSDFPVEHFNPLYGFHAAVGRVDKSGYPTGGFQMENAIDRVQALKGMTIWAAYSCFQDRMRGSIEKGKDADFVMLEDDIMLASLTQLRTIKTLWTVIAGHTEYKKKN
ncbi:amidohydrolase [Sphingobacterium sp. HJSM2_6]|uniref:amidohydrolase n=1 Tax=Sphingobacterium sp. HJSM2_6 TaxID=3366264 RepID=UPI003BCCEBE2